MNDQQPGLETISSYLTQTTAGEMLPTRKLQDQDRQIASAMKTIRQHRTRALEMLADNAVLVCDPDSGDRLLIAENLKKAGYIVFIATDCKECEEILKTIPVKAVIVDTRFQGLEIIRKVNGSTKIILSGDPGIAHAALPGAEHVANALDAVAAVVGA